MVEPAHLTDPTPRKLPPFSPSAIKLQQCQCVEYSPLTPGTAYLQDVRDTIPGLRQRQVVMLSLQDLQRIHQPPHKCTAVDDILA